MAAAPPRRSSRLRVAAALLARALAFAALAVSSALAAEPSRVLVRDIPAGPLSRALADALAQTHWRVAYLSAKALGRQSPGARAGLDETQALASLLDGTHLAARPTGNMFILVEQPDEAAAGEQEKSAVPRAQRRAQHALSPELPEVIVTASHKVLAPLIPPPLVTPLPLTVGLCVEDDLQHAQLRRADHRATLDRSHSRARPRDIWEVGEAANSSVEQIAQALFARLLVLTDCRTGESTPDGLDGVLAVSLDDASVTIPRWTSSPSLPPAHGPFSSDYLMARRASVSLAFELRGPGATPRVRWQVFAEAAAPRSPVFGTDDVALAMSLALRNAVARAIAKFASGEPERAWAESRGLAEGLVQ